MLQLIRCLFLLLTLAGVGMRAAEVQKFLHGSQHECSDHHHHDHEHGHDEPCPCDDSHHHHCSCLTPVFWLPVFPQTEKGWLNPRVVTPVDVCQWELPDDPVFTPEVPPIIA